MQMSVFRDVSTMQIFVLCADDLEKGVEMKPIDAPIRSVLLVRMLKTNFINATNFRILSGSRFVFHFSSTGSVDAFLHLVIVDNGSFDIMMLCQQEADDASPANNKH